MKAKLLRRRDAGWAEGHPNLVTPFTRRIRHVGFTYRVANLFEPVTGDTYHQRVRVHVGLLNPAEVPNLLRHFDKQIMGGRTPYRESRRVRYHNEALFQVARVNQSSSVKVQLVRTPTLVELIHDSRDALLQNPSGHFRLPRLRILPFVILHRPLPRLGKEVGRNADRHCRNCSDQQALTHVGSVSGLTR
jgi:hypothetical protein